MNYFVTATLGVSKNQDYSERTDKGLVICDGIGSLPDSAIVSSFVSRSFQSALWDMDENFEDQLVVDEIANKVKEIEGHGGTTLVYCRELDNKQIRIGYLGNGGVTALRGNFYQERIGEKIHVYTSLLLPHVDRSGILTRHISTNSKECNIQLSTIDLNLNSDSGDIFIFFSDGIGSIETQFIVNVEDEVLRLETALFQQLLESLHVCLYQMCELEGSNTDNMIDSLTYMLVEECARFKAQGLLEDDISIGVLVTDKVFDYYQSKKVVHE